MFPDENSMQGNKKHTSMRSSKHKNFILVFCIIFPIARTPKTHFEVKLLYIFPI